MTQSTSSLTAVLDDLGSSGGRSEVSVGAVLDAFRHRSLGVLLCLFGLLAAMPFIGAIPGMSILTGSLILLSIGHAVAGGEGLWAPQFVRRKSISRDSFDKGIDKARPWVGKVDRLLRPRLLLLVQGKLQRAAIAVVAALLALTFYPLAFIPFGVDAPAFGVVALGLGLIACDGLFVLFGYALGAVTIVLLLYAL